jgi:hypothetical protein
VPDVVCAEAGAALSSAAMISASAVVMNRMSLSSLWTWVREARDVPVRKRDRTPFAATVCGIDQLLTQRRREADQEF